MQTVAIVGVGLIGGSFALALRKAGWTGRILGVSSESTLRSALERGVIDEGCALDTATAQADFIYLAQPIGRILDTLHHIDAFTGPGTLITDAGSTKQAIVAAARRYVHRSQFLGGHPLAGKEKRGVASADPDLFVGRPYVVTPGDAPELNTPAASEFLDWLRRIGAMPVSLSPAEHDRAISFTSHLPQMASTALACTILEHGSNFEVAGPGLADMTRLAQSPYELWRDILATNAPLIEEALTAYIAKLEYLRENLRTRQMQTQFETAARLKK